MAARKDDSSVTHFRNVDLDIYSMYNLQPLVQSFGRKVNVLYVGRNRQNFCAHLELTKITKSANSTIQAFCALIRALPKQERERWDAAKIRQFSIGIQAGTHPNPCDFTVEAKTLNAMSELAARIVFTIYPFVKAIK